MPDPMVPLSPALIHILQHALGLAQHGREYRNHYVAGGRSVQQCRDLVAMGFLEEQDENPNKPCPVFYVTDEGKRVAHAEEIVL